MAQDTVNNDLYVNGNLAAKTFTPPAASITDVSIVGAAKIQASKLQQQHSLVLSQKFTDNAAVERRVVKRVVGATGTILDLRIGASTAAIGAATITVDLLKNGTTVLTGTVALTSATAAFATVQPGGYTSTDLVQGDILEIDLHAATAGGGTLAKGCFIELDLREDAQ